MCKLELIALYSNFLLSSKFQPGFNARDAVLAISLGCQKKFHISKIILYLK